MKSARTRVRRIFENSGRMLFAAGLLLLAAGCADDEVDIKDLRPATMELWQWLGPKATQPEVQLELSWHGSGRPCEIPRSDLRVTLDDDVTLDDEVVVGGWKSGSDECSNHARYNALAVPANEAELSTLQLADDGGSISMMVEELRMQRTAKLLAPADGRIHLHETVLVDVNRPEDDYEHVMGTFMNEDLEEAAIISTFTTMSYEAGKLSITIDESPFPPGTVKPVMLSISGSAPRRVVTCDAHRCSSTALFSIAIPVTLEL